MRIFTDTTGQLYVNAISTLANGKDVDGHLYSTQAGFDSSTISFQLGPIPETGVNGLTNEALLTILIHRTKILDSKYPCSENKLALAALDSALIAFNLRTTNRVDRGVEGKNLV